MLIFRTRTQTLFVFLLFIIYLVFFFFFFCSFSFHFFLYFAFFLPFAINTHTYTYTHTHTHTTHTHTQHIVWMGQWQDRTVAIKKLLAHILEFDEAAIQSFENEVKFMRTLRHKWVALFSFLFFFPLPHTHICFLLCVFLSNVHFLTFSSPSKKCCLPLRSWRARQSPIFGHWVHGQRLTAQSAW